MALIECPDCGQEVSSGAAHCLQCGCPIASRRVLVIPENERSWIDRLFIAVVVVCVVATLVIVGPSLWDHVVDRSGSKPSFMSFCRSHVDRVCSDVPESARRAECHRYMEGWCQREADDPNRQAQYNDLVELVDKYFGQ
jgi:hypothetical protein